MNREVVVRANVKRYGLKRKCKEPYTFTGYMS